MKQYHQLIQEKSNQSIVRLSMADVASTTCFQEITNRAITCIDFHFPIINCKLPFLAHLMKHQSVHGDRVCIMLLSIESYNVFRNDFFRDYSDNAISRCLDMISPETLFGITISDSFAEMIVNNEPYDSSLSQIDRVEMSYFGKGILESLEQRKKAGTLSAAGLNKSVNELLSSCLSFKKDHKITDIMLIKLIHDAYQIHPSTTLKWIIDNLKLLSIHPLSCKEILSLISSDFRTTSVSRYKILKAILTNFAPTDYVHILYGYTDANKVYLQDRSSSRSKSFGDLESIFLADMLFSQAGASTKNIVHILTLMKEKYDLNYPITPELITSSFFRTGSHHNDSLTNIYDINEVPLEIKEWVIKEAKVSKNFNLDIAICATLEGKSRGRKTINKILFLLDNFNKDKSYIPSALAVSRAIASNNSNIVRILTDIKKRSSTDIKEYRHMANGFHKDTSSEVLTMLVDFFKPYIEDMIRENCADHNDTFEIFKTLQTFKKSQQGLAQTYLKEYFNDKKIIKKITGRKQLEIYIGAFNLTPYEILTDNISERINELCVEIIGS